MVSQGALVAIALATLATFDPGWGKRLLASLIAAGIGIAESSVSASLILAT